MRTNPFASERRIRENPIALFSMTTSAFDIGSSVAASTTAICKPACCACAGAANATKAAASVAWIIWDEGKRNYVLQLFAVSEFRLEIAGLKNATAASRNFAGMPLLDELR